MQRKEKEKIRKIRALNQIQGFSLYLEEHFKRIPQTIYMDIFAICKLQSEDWSCYFGMILQEDPGKSNTGYFIKWIEGTLKLTQQEEKRKPRMLDLTPTK